MDWTKVASAVLEWKGWVWDFKDVEWWFNVFSGVSKEMGKIAPEFLTHFGWLREYGQEQILVFVVREDGEEVAIDTCVMTQESGVD